MSVITELVWASVVLFILFMIWRRSERRRQKNDAIEKAGLAQPAIDFEQKDFNPT